MIIVVVFIAAVIVVGTIILGIVVTKKRNAEKQKYYSAAANIVKEDLLNYSIQNRMIHNSVQPTEARLMLYLKTIDANNKYSYVFDPAKIIRIGRKKINDKNTICLNDIKVSHEHCAIYTDGYKVYLQDMNSLNGSIVKRGFRKYMLNGGNVMEIKSKDKLYIGSVIFQVTIFYYDSLTM